MIHKTSHVALLCTLSFLGMSSAAHAQVHQKSLRDRIILGIAHSKYSETFNANSQSRYPTVELFLQKNVDQIKKCSINDKKEIAILLLVHGNIIGGGPAGVFAEAMGKDRKKIGEWLLMIDQKVWLEEWQLTKDRVDQIRNISEMLVELG